MRIGIIGAGQLGQMLGFAAGELDMECRFLDPSAAPPAAAAGHVIRRPFDDADALQMLADGSDVITFEFENVPTAALLRIRDQVPVYPPPAALGHAQDRLFEKRLFESLGIPLPQFRAVDSLTALQRAADDIGTPLVVKTRRLGYDGKGQFVVRNPADAEDAWRTLGKRGLIAEAWVPFDYEVSAIGARSVSGRIAIYPLTQNEHAGGILRMSRAPVDAPALSALADDYLIRLLTNLDYVGVLALELFVTGNTLLANEFAPRVHNSGHWTIEGAETSQFSNHLRAIADLPLGSTACRGPSGMVNLIGGIPDAARTLADDVCRLHEYGKSPREGRKLGHITVVAASAGKRDQQLAAIRQTLPEL